MVVANPPYMGSSSLGKWMGAWVKKHYPEAYRDLCTSFIDRGFGMSADDGYSAMVTMQSWMFLGSFEKLRGKILRNHSISSMAHLGTRAFGAIGGEVVSTTATVFANAKSEAKGAYFRLVDMGSEKEKQAGLLESLANPDCGWFYRADASSFKAIPGSPIAYWASASLCNAFKSAKPISSYMNSRSGITAGSSDFVRYWHEVALTQIGFNCKTYRDMGQKRWFPINSGGAFRMFYGNNEKIINLWNDGADIKNSGGNYRLREKEYYFKRGITWGRITSADISFRATAPGTLFGDAGPVGFVESKQDYLLGFLSTNMLKAFADILNPTLNCQITDIERIPLIIAADRQRRVESYVKECMVLSEQDWDSFEESWDFSRHPLL